MKVSKKPTSITDLKKRLIMLAHKHNLSHLGSCLTALPILYEIYLNKKKKDLVVLSQGHSGLALYVVLEEFKGEDAEALLERHGVHPNRDLNIDCSTGSLGHGLPIAVGMALADRSKEVHCVTSDGEMAEGSMWEALRIAKELNLTNLKVYLNANGYSAYDSVDTKYLVKRIKAFEFPVHIYHTKLPKIPFLEGLQAHYHTMSKKDYEQLLLYYHEA
jgi:transketolase